MGTAGGSMGSVCDGTSTRPERSSARAALCATNSGTPGQSGPEESDRFVRQGRARPLAAGHVLGEGEVSGGRGREGEQPAAAGDADGRRQVGLGVGQVTQPVLADAQLRRQQRKDHLVGTGREGMPHEGLHGLLCVLGRGVHRLQPEARAHQSHRGHGCAPGALRCLDKDPVHPVPGRLHVIDDPAFEGDGEPGLRVLFDHVGVAAYERRDRRALPAQHHPQAFGREHVGGQVTLADGHQSVERALGVAAREIEVDGAGDGGPGSHHVDATDGQAAPHDLGEERVDPVVRIGVVADPRDQQPGELQVREHVAGDRIVGEQDRCRDRDDLLGGDAEQQVPLAGWSAANTSVATRSAMCVSSWR